MQDTPTISYVQNSDSWLKRNAVNLIEVATGRDRLTEIYTLLRNEPFEIPRFFSRAIELGGLRLSYNSQMEQQIPREGPLVFIANHPFGIVDGLVLCELASRLRGDFRILLNNRLCKDEQLNQFFLPISFDGTREASRLNIETKRTAQNLLAQGGTLVIFPGGGVSTRWKFGTGPLEEFPWTTFTAKIVRHARATVVPIHFHGENSPMFHFASSISESLRLSLFIHEVARQIGSTISFTIGEPLPFELLAALDNRKSLTGFLKQKTDELALPEHLDPN